MQASLLWYSKPLIASLVSKYVSPDSLNWHEDIKIGFLSWFPVLFLLEHKGIQLFPGRYVLFSFSLISLLEGKKIVRMFVFAIIRKEFYLLHSHR